MSDMWLDLDALCRKTTYSQIDVTVRMFIINSLAFSLHPATLRSQISEKADLNSLRGRVAAVLEDLSAYDRFSRLYLLL